MGVKCAWDQARAVVGGGNDTGHLDGWVPAPPLQGAVSWRCGSEGSNTPSPYSPSCGPVQQGLPRRSPARNPESEGSPGISTVLSSPCLPVSLDTSVSLLRAHSLPSCPFLVGLSLPMCTTQQEMCSNLHPCTGWAQADGLRPTLLNQQCSWVKLSRACSIRNRTEMSLGFVQPQRERFSVILPFCLPCPIYPQQLLS